MDHHEQASVVSVFGVQSVKMQPLSNQKSILSPRQSPHQASPVQQLKFPPQSMTQRFNTTTSPQQTNRVQLELENEDLKQKLSHQNDINQKLLEKLDQLQQIVNQQNNQLAFETENKCNILMAELDRVNQALEYKNKECQHLEKQILLGSPRDITQRTTETPRKHSEIRKQSDDKDRLISQLTNKLNHIAEEMQNLTTVLEAKIEENKQLKQATSEPVKGQLLKFQQMLQTKQTELEMYRSKAQQAGELNQKLFVVTQELEKMNIVLLAKSEELERCKFKIQSLEEQNAEVFSLQHAVSSNYKAIQSKQSQIQSYQDEISRLDFQLKNKTQTLSNVQSELEVLKIQFDEKQGEIDDLRNKNGKLRIEMSEIKVQAECFVNVKQEYERCQQILKNKENEINHYKQEFHKSQNKLSEVQQQLLQVQENVKDLEMYKLSVQELQTQKLVLSEKSKNVDSLTSEVQMYLTKIKEQESNIIILDNERRRLIGKSSLKKDLQRMKQEECDALRQALQQLTIQHGKVVEQSALVKEQYIEIEQWKQRYQRLEIQYADLQRESNLKTKNFHQELDQLRLKINVPVTQHEENAILKDTVQMLQNQVLNLQQDVYQRSLESEKEAQSQQHCQHPNEQELKRELEKKNFIINRLFSELDQLRQTKLNDQEEKEEIDRLNREIIRQKIIINNLYVQISDLQYYGNQDQSENFNIQNKSKIKLVDKH